MKIICLNDKYKPQDRVSHGKVKCFDQSGNKIFDNSNMIVATGRSAIRNICLKNILQNCEIYIGNTGTTPTDYSKESYGAHDKWVEAGYEKIAKTKMATDTSKVIGAGPVFTTIKSTVKTTDNKDKIINILVKDGQITEYEDSADNREKLADPKNPDFVRIVVNIPPRNDYKEISDLCIVQPVTLENGTKSLSLFSRVCFDRIPLDNNNGYTLIYFIYF